MQTRVVKIFAKNSDFQYIETLRRNRIKRNRTGEFFVEGVRAINQALQNRWQINALVYSRDKRLSDWAEGVIEKSNAKIYYELSFQLLKELSQKEESSELIAIMAMPKDDLSRIPVHNNLLVVLLDRPMLPGNIGSIIRSCDAFQVDGLIITGHSADLYDPETIRATTGSFFCIPTVRLSSDRELVPWIDRMRTQSAGFQVVGTDEKASESIRDFDFTSPTLLMAGNETHGLSERLRSLCDVIVNIPMDGCASSLNLACATSIILYEINRQRA